MPDRAQQGWQDKKRKRRVRGPPTSWRRTWQGRQGRAGRPRLCWYLELEENEPGPHTPQDPTPLAPRASGVRATGRSGSPPTRDALQIICPRLWLCYGCRHLKPQLVFSLQSSLSPMVSCSNRISQDLMLCFPLEDRPLFWGAFQSCPKVDFVNATQLPF